jgi:hypothetical protein
MAVCWPPYAILLLIGATPLLPADNALHHGAGYENFIYVGSGKVESIRGLLSRGDIAGAQVVYNWRQLETARGQYDFSEIQSDLRLSNSLRKKLFIQIQDRFFSPEARNVPDYLLTDPVYRGGIVPQVDNPGEDRPPVMGWVAQQWNPAVQRRYQQLLQALAGKFDGVVYGINLPETAIDIDRKGDRTGFRCERYFEAEMDNLAFARKVFQKSYVVQYVNFWPCEWGNDRDYMGRLFEFAVKNGVGLGGADIVPNRKAQMANSYPFFHKYKDKIRMIAMAVQEPTLTYTNPATAKAFTKEEFAEFATQYLGARIIFWSAASPWLRK